MTVEIEKTQDMTSVTGGPEILVLWFSPRTMEVDDVALASGLEASALEELLLQTLKSNREESWSFDIQAQRKKGV